MDTTAPHTLRGAPRALIIEDSQAVRRQTSQLLSAAGYLATTAETGLEGLRKAEALPDIIVVDLHLPDLSGLAICKTLRTSPQTTGIPVVMLTADATPKTIAQAFRNGASDYIQKPFVDDVFLLRLNRIVRERISEAEASRRYDALSEAHRALAVARADLLMQQRLSSLGLMMSGLAHEMNSPLGAQLASLQFVLDGQGATPEDVYQAVQDAMKAGQRVSHLVRRMCAIAGSEDRTIQHVSLRGRAEMASAAFPMLHVDIVGDDIVVPAVESEIREALGALLDNSARAAASSTSPYVRVTVREERGFAAIVVEDNGPGIAEEDLPYVLTPFFTRHRGARATGLGLSLVDAAARRHRGHLVVDGHGQLGGARVTIYLPFAEDSDSSHGTALSAH